MNVYGSRAIIFKVYDDPLKIHFVLKNYFGDIKRVRNEI